jgi:hypothetical protein
MKNLLEELKQLESYRGAEFAVQVNSLYNDFPDDKKEIDGFLNKRLNTLLDEADTVIEAGVRHQFSEITEMLSLSYIAKRYFHKSRQWLNHRINGSVVNGKPAKFTDEQLKTLNSALHDISNRIGSIHIT